METLNSIDTVKQISSFQELFREFQTVAAKHVDANTASILIDHDSDAIKNMHREQKIMMQNLLAKYTFWQKVDMLEWVHDYSTQEWLESTTKPYIEKHILYSIVNELEKKIFLHFANMEKWETREKFELFLKENNVSVEEMQTLIELMQKKESSYLRSYWEDHKVTYEWIIKTLSECIRIYEAENVQDTKSWEIVDTLQA